MDTFKKKLPYIKWILKKKILLNHWKFPTKSSQKSKDKAVHLTSESIVTLSFYGRNLENGNESPVVSHLLSESL